MFIFLLILGELFWEYFKYIHPEPLHVCKQGIRVQYVCESWWWVRGRPENIFYFHKGTLQTHLMNQWVMYLIFLKANSFHLFTIQFAFPPVLQLSALPYHVFWTYCIIYFPSCFFIWNTCLIKIKFSFGSVLFLSWRCVVFWSISGVKDSNSDSEAWNKNKVPTRFLPAPDHSSRWISVRAWPWIESKFK